MTVEWRQRVFCVALLFVCSVALVVVGAYLLWAEHVRTTQAPERYFDSAPLSMTTPSRAPTRDTPRPGEIPAFAG